MANLLCLIINSSTSIYCRAAIAIITTANNGNELSASGAVADLVLWQLVL